MRIVWTLAACAALLLGSTFAAVRLVATGPRIERRPRPVAPTLVEVTSVTFTEEPVHVVAMGTVIPARETQLQPEVGGRVVELNPRLVPGGLFRAGEVMLRIEPDDYQAVVLEREAQLAQARLDLKVEEGRHTIAEREWALLGAEVPAEAAARELALRTPHLTRARAALKAAEGALQRARRDVERTAVRAPFNAVIREENVEVGQLLSPQTPIARVVGTDEAWVQVSLPLDRLAALALPDAAGRGGAAARILYEPDGVRVERPGRVVRLLADLDPVGRMARLLVAVQDPFGLEGDGPAGGLPLLLGTYVRVEIEGRRLSRVVRLPRDAVHEGDRVWVMGPDGRLEIRKVEVAWRSETSVLVRRGLRNGERVVVSGIANPLPGMPLRVASAGGAPPDAAAGRSGGGNAP